MLRPFTLWTTTRRNGDSLPPRKRRPDASLDSGTLDSVEEMLQPLHVQEESAVTHEEGNKSTSEIARHNSVYSTFKFCLLTVLAVQTAATALVGRYTRASLPADKLYDINQLVLTVEIVKLFCSCLLESYHTSGKLLSSIHTFIIQRPNDALKAAVPAVMYVLQSSLIYLGLSNLPAPLFLATNQLKLIATALVSVAILQRSYNKRQWFCLFAISTGVGIVVLDESDQSSKTDQKSVAKLIVGLLAVVGASLSSAFAGVYFERVLKQPTSDQEQPSLWMRNIQLAIFGILTTTMRLRNNETTLWYGFTDAVWLLVGLQATGGLLVAAAMKYADNVLKGLAAAVAIVLATIGSVLIFHQPVRLPFIEGAALIFVAVYFFSNPCPEFWPKR